MKKLLLALLLFVALLLMIWAYVNRSATVFTENSRFFYLGTDSASLNGVIDQLKKQGILRNTGTFELLAKKFDYADKVKPGRYRITKGMSEMDIFRKLRNGSQDPVKLVINKLRTPEDFAKLAGRQLEPDSLDFIEYLHNNTALEKYGLDSFTAMTTIIPDTYEFFWNTSVAETMNRLHKEKEKFWTEKRKNKAKALGLSIEEVYTLASLVEEETNKHDEKPRVASVYINRLKKGMTLGADPTIKYALRDFGIKRILLKHISASASSPYNTYRQKGLPPGPICTPSSITIDAVLDAEKTDYLFFCAKADFSGYHTFAATDLEHLKNAKAYQMALDSLNIK